MSEGNLLFRLGLDGDRAPLAWEVRVRFGHLESVIQMGCQVGTLALDTGLAHG